MVCMSTLSVNIFETPSAVVVRLEGEAGIRAADELQAPFRKITEARPSLVVLDLAELQFVASLFLGLLVNFRKGIVYQGGRIQMAAVQPNIRDILKVTRLEELFEFVESAPQEPQASVS